MKTFIFLLTLSSVLFASADTATCKKCHPTISKEFQDSMHKKSSIYDDKIHKAVWDKHPAKAKGNYKCAKCHTPNAETEEQAHEGITCISCHTIMSVEKHGKANKNIYSTEKKTFYSAELGRESEKVVYKTSKSWWGKTSTVGSAYHDIDYTNKNYYDANMCMGCHSHKQNSHQFEVCTTDKAKTKDTKQNCITCHMPKVDGTATTVKISTQHSFHGFSGARKHHKMLSKYVLLDYAKNENGFEISVKNEAPHNLLTHPLRVVQLRTTLIRDEKQTHLKTHTFVKIIGKDGKPSMPWVANEVIKDNMIKGNEKRVIKFANEVKSGDKLEVVLGFYVVNPKALKKLNLQNEKELREFSILKSQYFNVE